MSSSSRLATLLLAAVSGIAGCEAASKMLAQLSGEQEHVADSSADEGDSGRTAAAPACGGPGYPCTWAEVPTQVQERTREVATRALTARFDGDSPGAIASALEAETDVIVLAADDHTIRYRVEGGRPAWVFLETSQTVGQGGSQIGGPIHVPFLPLMADPEVMRPVGKNPSGSKPKKKVLILSPFRWQWQIDDEDDETETIEKLFADVPDYQGGVDRRENPLSGNSIAFAMGLEDFMGWKDFDVIHVSTHGTSCDAAKKKQAMAEGRTYDCVTALATGEVWQGMGDSAQDPDVKAFLRAQGIDVGFIPIVSRLAEPIENLEESLEVLRRNKDVGAGEGGAMAGETVWVAGPFVLVTSEFFEDAYPDKLDDKIIFLSACKSAQEDDLLRALAGNETVIVGWDKVMTLDTASDAAKYFWGLLLGQAVGSVPEQQGGRTVEEAFRFLEGWSDDHGVLQKGPLKSVVIDGAPTQDEATGATLEPDGETKTRAREIVGLVQPEQERALMDGDVVSIEGAPGDGKPDALELTAEVIGVGEDEPPGSFVIHVDVDGKTAKQTWKPTKKIAEGVWRGEATVDLGFDLERGQTFALEPWVELPGGGVSRWRYEDIGVEYFVLTVSGPAFPTPQTFVVDPEHVSLDLFDPAASMRYVDMDRNKPNAAVSEDGSRVDMVALSTEKSEPGTYPLTPLTSLSLHLYSATGSPVNCPAYADGCHNVGLDDEDGTVTITKVRYGKSVYRYDGTGPNIWAGSFDVELVRTNDGHEGQRYQVEASFLIVD